MTKNNWWLIWKRLFLNERGEKEKNGGLKNVRANTFTYQEGQRLSNRKKRRGGKNIVKKTTALWGNLNDIAVKRKKKKNPR